MSSSTEGLNQDFSQRLQALVEASGGQVRLGNGFRSNAEQQALWDNALKKYGSESEARKWVAKPGSSNHEKGLAGDLEGNLALAHQLAPQFGLHFPMAHEPWHVEPIGLRSNPAAYTTPRSGDPVLDEVMNSFSKAIEGMGDQSTTVGEQASSVGEAITAVGKDSPITTGLESEATEDSAIMAAPSKSFANIDGVDAFMRAISGKESGGNPNAVNKDSGAYGEFQIMPDNWGPWAAEAGLGANAPRTPENQRKVARFKMQQYYDQFGDWGKVAKAWYSGPGNVDKNVGGGPGYPSSDEYAQDVLKRMAG